MSRLFTVTKGSGAHCTKNCNFNGCETVADPGFRREGANPKGSANLLFYPIFLKMKKIESRGEGRASKICLCKSANSKVATFL